MRANGKPIGWRGEKARHSRAAEKGWKHRKPKISKTQIRIGTDVEMEHTNSRRVARRIALDHLREHPQYYTYLRQMEKKLKV